MSRKRGGKIPMKAQLPLAAVLIVVFGVVLFWRFGPDGDGAAAAVVEKGLGALVSISELDDLESLIEVLEQNALVRGTEATSGVELERDPFVKARAFSPGMTPHQGEAMAVQEEVDDTAKKLINREEFLEETTLTAIIMMGERSVAVLDTEYLRTGDTIAGFVVAQISEDHIVLRDELGSELVRLKERWRREGEESRAQSTHLIKDGEL